MADEYIDIRETANTYGGNITGPYLAWGNLYNFRPESLADAENFAALITERTGIPATVEVLVKLERTPTVSQLDMVIAQATAMKDVAENGLPPVPTDAGTAPQD